MTKNTIDFAKKVAEIVHICYSS